MSPCVHNEFCLSYSVTLVPITSSLQSKTRYKVLLIFLFLFASCSSHGAENQFLISPVKNRFEFNKQEYIFFFPGTGISLPNFLYIQFLSKSSEVILLLQTYLASFLEMRVADGEIFIKIFNLEIN